MTELAKIFEEISLQDLLKPSYVKNDFDCIQLDESFNRVIMAVGYPRTIKEGWLDRLISTEGDFDLSLFVEPREISSVLSSLNKETVKQKSDILAMQDKGILNPSLSLQYEDTIQSLQRLQAGKEKLFNFSLYVNVRSDSKEKLDLLTKKIEAELNSIMVVPKIPFFKMQQGFQSILPIQSNKLRMHRNILSNALSACFPFTSSFLELDENGVMFGVNKENDIPLILDLTQFTNLNGLILGCSGSGKSFFVQTHILRQLMNGTKVVVVDPQGEYTGLVEAMNGQLIEISRNSKTLINPLDPLGQELEEKLLSLLDLFEIMFSDLNDSKKNILYKALKEAYKRKQKPVLSDLEKILKEFKEVLPENLFPVLASLLDSLTPYLDGCFSFLNQHTHIDPKKDFICFNIRDIPNQVKPIMMFLILEFVYRGMHKDMERKLVVLDEAWSLLKHTTHSQYIYEMIKTARKFNLGIVLVTQEVNDLLSSNAGKTVLANTSWKMLLRQESGVIGEVVEKFCLNPEEQNFLLTAGKGEGLLFAMNEHIPLKIVASEQEHKLITGKTT